MNQPNSVPDRAARGGVGDFQGEYHEAVLPAGRRPLERGRTAVWQARLVILVMINIAQLWILSATVEAALARHYKQLLPLVIASGVCWVISLTIFLWWKPAPRRTPAAGYVTKSSPTPEK